MDLLKKIESKKFNVGIIGLGYVGLPLAYSFSSKGIKTIGFDINKKQINLLKKNKSYLKHISDSKIKIMNEKGFEVQSDLKKIKHLDVIIICLPTPLNEHNEPDLSAIINTGQAIAPYLQKNQLIVLESSSYPGTTDEILAKSLKGSKLKKNKDYFLAYSPEREDPGNKKFSLSNTPKVVSGFTKRCLMLCKTLYSKISSQTVEVKDLKTAEAVKIYENIFRSINISLVNEMHIILSKLKINIYDVIKAAKH